MLSSFISKASVQHHIVLWLRLSIYIYNIVEGDSVVHHNWFTADLESVGFRASGFPDWFDSHRVFSKYTHTHLHTRTYTHTYTPTHIHTYTHTPTQTTTHTYTNNYAHLHTYVHSCLCSVNVPLYHFLYLLSREVAVLTSNTVQYV